MPTAVAKVESLARRMGLIRPRELIDRGLPPTCLSELAKKGVLQRPARGVFLHSSRELSEHHSLEIVAKRVPNGVVCLLSALVVHGIGTQNPREIWVAIGPKAKARAPRLDYPPLRTVRFPGKAATDGVQELKERDRRIRVYSPAKTVADCFKFRNRIGLDVALEALREGWRTRTFSMDELDRCAAVCRVRRVMRPYLESLTALVPAAT